MLKITNIVLPIMGTVAGIMLLVTKNYYFLLLVS